MPIINARHMELDNLAGWLYHAAERKVLLSIKATIDAKVAELGDVSGLIPLVPKSEGSEELVPMAIEALTAPDAATYSLGVANVLAWVDSVARPADKEHPDARTLKIENILKLLRVASTLSKLLPA